MTDPSPTQSSPMRVTVLGSGAACPPAGQNSSGFLVEDQGQAILLDCGPGVVPTLQEAQPAFHLDHVFISHMHPDHFVDLLPLRFRVSRRLDGPRERRVTLHLPPGGVERVADILDAVSFPSDFLSNTFRLREYDPDRSLTLGPLTVRFAAARHYILAYAVRIDGSASVVYSGDTGPSAAVTRLANEADLFICEATLREPEGGPRPGHCTPSEAATMARNADAKRLLLTHFWYDSDLQAVEEEANALFKGPLDIARDGLTISLDRGA